MMDLFIDGKVADTDALTAVYVTVSVASVTMPEYGRAGYSKYISIPMTPSNCGIMGDCEQVNVRDKFNAALHEARVESDGCVIMEGFMRLVRCEKSGEAGRYVFYIMGPSKLWADYAARTAFSSLFPEYSVTIDANRIKDSWTSSTPVRWLPVSRNRYDVEEAGTNGQVNLLSVNDYHPFIHCRTMLRRVLSDAGYSLSSDFIDSTYFDTFYMSGRFTTHDVGLLKERMDFRAGRFNAASAAANQYGIVYANPGTAFNTVGNIVDTANPQESLDGRTIEGVFDNGGCFVKNGNRISFVPKYSLTAGFEYKLKYVTEYRVRSSTELGGFDKIYLGNGQTVQLTIPNTFQDRRQEFHAGKEYRCFICDYTAGYTYRLIANKVHSSWSEEYIIGQFTTPSALVSVSDAVTYTNLRVMYMATGSTSYVSFAGEWALYDGYVAEKGETEVEVTVRSKPERITPASPKYFDTVYFAGAQSGMKFKLVSAEIRPVFQMHPTEGDTVSFYDLAVHNTNCLSVMKALGEMFGWCYYTDEIEKKVYVEPRDMFHRDDVVVDWSDRVDFSRPVITGEISAEVPGRIVLKYRSGDGATEQLNRRSGDKFGLFSVETGNVWHESEEKVFENRFFSTTVNSKGVLASAVSASVPNAGDIAGSEAAGEDSLNFNPKIIRYPGMKRLSGGQTWGWPSFSDSYPLSAFHYPEPVYDITKPAASGIPARDTVQENPIKGFTLCYEDRGGVAGLHRWWDCTLDTYRNGIRLTAWLSLGADEIEAFVRPNYLMQDFRARFRLHIDGEWSDWRLEEICDYTPQSASTKCVFVKII